jgi:hypothetical protein
MSWWNTVVQWIYANKNISNQLNEKQKDTENQRN